ncbi:MAG TPA: DinB family protein [Bacteroidia bacterium]|nr:DinB family protein [Bacteroidia bacterium]
MLLANDYYDAYIRLVPWTTPDEALAKGMDAALQTLITIPADKWDYSYAPGKWSIKELVQHVMDTERIFSYRALSFARGETTHLPPFEENAYAQNSFAAWRNPESIIEEYKAIRASTGHLYRSFTPTALDRTGIANNLQQNVRRIAFIIAGHEAHHLNILKERYLAG